MSTWRHLLLEHFPEFDHGPESWDLIMAAARLSALLERSVRIGENEAGTRVLRFVLWADEQSKADERFIYFCQDVMRSTITYPSLRPVFTTLLNGRSFAQIVGYVEYLTSKSVVAEMAAAVRALRRED